MKIIQEKPPVFEIPASVWETVTFDEIVNTFDEMYEANLISPPFNHFYVRSPLPSLFRSMIEWVKKGDASFEVTTDDLLRATEDIIDKPLVIQFIFRPMPVQIGCKDDYEIKYFIFVGEGKSAIPWDLITGMPRDLSESLAMFIYKTLITLLVTKNCDRKVIENNPRAKTKKARDDSKHYSMTTYISIGRITETYRSKDGSRGPVRPHLRRGHVRRQRYGEGRAEIKRIFIPPVFVNADKEWIAESKKYKLVA